MPRIPGHPRPIKSCGCRHSLTVTRIAIALNLHLIEGKHGWIRQHRDVGWSVARAGQWRRGEHGGCHGVPGRRQQQDAGARMGPRPLADRLHHLGPAPAASQRAPPPSHTSCRMQPWPKANPCLRLVRAHQRPLTHPSQAASHGPSVPSSKRHSRSSQSCIPLHICFQSDGIAHVRLDNPEAWVEDQGP